MDRFRVIHLSSKGFLNKDWLKDLEQSNLQNQGLVMWVIFLKENTIQLLTKLNLINKEYMRQ